jgi:phenylacetic acid degradation operon negative regulatory protein
LLSIEKQILFLLSRTQGMDAQEVIRIYERRGYSPQYIRNAFSHLKKEGYIVSPSRSFYGITEPGRQFIYSINQKPLLYDHVWDHNWYLVMVEIPESERRKRDQFRNDILQVGFGLLYHSVYMAPWDYSEEVAQLIQKHGINGNVTVFKGTIHNREITPEHAAVIWQLDALEQKYQEQSEWFIHEFKPRLQKLLETEIKPDPLDLFLLYLNLGEVVSELYLVDPMLPQELLPTDWNGKRILQELRHEAQRLVNLIPADSIYARFL